MHSATTPFDFYLLRLPLLPISELLRLHASWQQSEDIAGAMHALYQAPDLQEAIYLVSPELYQEMRKWLARPADSQQPDDKRLLLTLYKYLLRMSSRCTPYGLFAGFSTGRVASQPTHLQLAPPASRHYKHARLDMNYITELSKQVVADAELRTRLSFFVNTSLYKTRDAYRYYEYRIRNKQRYYYLVAVKASRYLELILAAAATGATYAHLLQVLTQAGAAPDSAQRYLNQLIDGQILLSELEPTVTGPEFFNVLVEKVQAIGPQHPSLQQLQQIQALLQGPTIGTGTYQAVEQIIRQAFPSATSKDLIQTDLRLNMSANTLNKEAVTELSQNLNALTHLFKAALPPDLQTFIKNFYERYEEQEIPLLEALDSEAGLGYGKATGARVNHTPLVDDVRTPGKPGIRKINWSEYRQLIVGKFLESQARQLTTITLTDDDLAPLAADNPVQLPSTLFAIGSLVAASAEALDAGEFKFNLMSYSGPGAMSLLARFAHAEPALAEKLAACAEHEQATYGEALLAEIVHLPNAHTGNVIQRSKLREYEIPFLGNASVPLDKQLPASDLLVSVRNGKVVLRSKRLNKQVLPRLTTAHNYNHGLSIYKFLCDLQAQQNPFTVVWDWDFLRQQAYLPRVEYKHVILSRARWHLPATAHPVVAAVRTPEQLRAFREQYHLPEQVVLADFDNELLLDFACPLAIEILAQQLKKGPVILLEFVHRPDTTLVGGEGLASYVNEVIVPFAHTAPAPAPKRLPTRPATTVQRTFALGSEWTYLKVYCGAKWADRILTEHLLPCIQELEAQHGLRRWFFIRYNDPKPHLRLRLQHDAEPGQLAAIIARLHQALAPLQQERVVQSIQYDTYHRELERYGTATIGFSETFFHYDSKAVAGFLNLIEGDEGEHFRWLFAVRGVDQLLSDFNLSLPDKLALTEHIYQAFFQEFNGNAQLKHQLNDKYREVSRTLTSFLDPANDTPYIQEAVDLFNNRSVALRAAYDELQSTWATHYPGRNVAASISELLPSYLHMFLNRIFIADQRLHELVVYHYLTKYYASALARTKQRQPVAQPASTL
ncbi:lantibiotic dehydratase [Hymenobacter pini]|uniref:lantibiotic dehydratase n=1 Tax=Hymenobacter pini TaxID=2880879 RepID=UPI001CF0FB9E|nr:lantibiotic dehydratase [Hymenobacter pini]MCA8832852.1 lantibiotic dehydratase [Hymenobacter pini]